MQKPLSSLPKRIKKPWGYEEILEHGPKYTVKKLLMKKGHQCSYQYHELKQETVLVLDGAIQVVLEDSVKTLRPFESITILPGVKHRMRAEEGDCLYMECSTSELDDVVRLEDDYGRKIVKQ